MDRKLINDLLDLFYHPTPFFWHGLPQFSQGSSHPSPQMKLANLVFQIKLTGNLSIGRQIIRHHHAHSHLLYQWLQEPLHCLWILFVYIPDGDRPAISHIDCHHHRLGCAHPSKISNIQSQHPYSFPLLLTGQLPGSLLHIPPPAHPAQFYSKEIKHNLQGSITQSQHPHDPRHFPQSLALAFSIYSLGVMPKGLMTPTAPISTHVDFFHFLISDHFSCLSPTLKYLSFTIRAFLWPFAGLALDICEFDGDN